MGTARWSPAGGRSRGRPGLAAAVVAGLAGLAGVAGGQAPADPRLDLRLDQTGRMLDANPQLGGPRLNYSRPLSPLMTGNALAEGVIRGGLSLRGVSPISDPLWFRGPLPSSSLYTFRRDSVSVADAAVPGGPGFGPQPYYDPARTAGTVGFLRGLTAPGAPGAGPLDLRIDQRIDYQRGLEAQIVGLRPPEVAAGTDSGIFGLGPPPRLLLPTEVELPWDRHRPVLPGGPDEGGPPAGELSDVLAEAAAALDTALATPLNVALGRQFAPQVGARGPPGEPPPWAGRVADGMWRPGLLVPPPEPAAEEPTATLRPRITDPSLLPGYDVFNDLQLALALAENPGAPWFQDLVAALRAQPELAEAVAEDAAEEPEAYIERLRSAPLRTFIGGGASALNNELLKAESLMDIGHYAEAAEHYERARLIDPTNPLPLIGRGHALLAAGDYRSAAFALLSGLERFPALARFSIDLTALLGSGEIIDIRRADLLDALRQRETPELRFLLGYLEYHTGDRERGLANLERAARHPLASALIARYPELLRARAETPAAPQVPPPDGERRDRPEPAPRPEQTPADPPPGAADAPWPEPVPPRDGG